ncbi:transcriptional regulator [Corynebacterium alimapuense]|uniref:MarR family transcriptional regulator n=1 Tax=Corynebacterium alimapuense TaxID=1576874 RepID=A0A3M8KA66_9CORY|nr:transcriptional regulator [Corynebacterium alimapuense]RNE49422.1 MarR family transcriptional regulator [Corynebacterium alimapuense]
MNAHTEIDPVLYPINRLRICTALKAAGATEGGGVDREMKFTVLQELATLSDAELSEQLGELQSHGYITRHREYGSSRPKDTVWISLTAVGDAALTKHLSALRSIAGATGDDQPDRSDEEQN